MRNQRQYEDVAERFYIDLKGPIGVFVPEFHLTILSLESDMVNKIFCFFLKM